MLTPVEHLPLTVVLLALLTLQLLWKTLKALSPWQSLSLHWLCWHEIYRCSYPSNFCREPDEGHKLWWEGQPLMTIDSHHEAASERIDSCFKLSRHGGVAVTKSASLSLLPAPINRIQLFQRDSAISHFAEASPRQRNVQGHPGRSYLFFLWSLGPSRKTETQSADHQHPEDQCTDHPLTRLEPGLSLMGSKDLHST